MRSLLTFLEDRRVLSLDFAEMSFADFSVIEIEKPDYVSQSLMNIREQTTTVLKQLPEGSPAAEPIRAMRAACTEYLTFIHAAWQKSQARAEKAPYDWREDPFAFNYPITLGQLRTAVGRELAILSDRYQLAIHEPLAKILPGNDQESESRYEESEPAISEWLDAGKRAGRLYGA